jgi:hypothetical protein
MSPPCHQLEEDLELHEAHFQLPSQYDFHLASDQLAEVHLEVYVEVQHS